jgi:8-oxo-dGTP pyrophosphatase MutT (NUDIX family)
MKQVTDGIIIDAGKVFIARRGPKSSLPGSWEFPGGKVEIQELIALATTVLLIERRYQ